MKNSADPTRYCICGKRIRWDDDFCSDTCEAEAERRAELDKPFGDRLAAGGPFRGK